MAAQAQREAQAAAAEQARKEQEKRAINCKKITDGTNTDVTDCKAGVNYTADMMINSCSSSGTINWSFSYKGNYLGTGISLPPQKYYSLVDCRYIINSSRNISLTTCATGGQRVIQQSCN